MKLRGKRAVDGKPSPLWAFMSVFKIGNPLYLWRLRIIECPWFRIYLHRIIRPDPDEMMHDHPWPWFSIILRGWYIERIIAGWQPARWDPDTAHIRVCMRTWFNKKSMDQYHKITAVSDKPCWTLVFGGPRTREWGFLTPTGWVHYKKYVDERDSEGNNDGQSRAHLRSTSRSGSQEQAQGTQGVLHG